MHRMTRPPLPRRLLAGLAALAVTATACGVEAGGDAGAAPSGDDADIPTSLVIATSFAISDLEPLDSGFWAPELGYGELLMKPVGGGEVEPWLLSSLELADERTWSLELRDGVTFQNGRALDAEALAALLEHHLDENPAVGDLLEGAEVAVVDDDTVELTTPEPAPTVPSLLAHEAVFPVFDLDAHAEADGDPDALVDARIWTGPYTVTSLDADTMELERTEGHHAGEPPLETLTVRFVPDEQARIRAVQNGEADLALYPPTAAARQLEGRADATFLAQPAGTAMGGMQLFVNTRHEALADRRVRRAVLAAVDYDELADDVLEGLYDRSVGLYPPSAPFVEELLETDPDAAGALLDEAGWERDGDGTRQRDGEPLTLRLLTYPQQPDVGVAAVAIQAQLAEVGIELAIRQVDDINAAMEEETGGWELGISMNSALDMTGADPVRPLTTYYATDGFRNHGAVGDEDLDARIDDLAVAVDEDERNALLAEIQTRIVAEEAWGTFLALKRNGVVASPDLAGYEVPRVANLWLEPYAP
jgi:peptide/nickel transport system substrate-binding protein